MHIVRLYRRFLLFRYVIPTCNARYPWLMSKLFLWGYSSRHGWILPTERASEQFGALHHGQVKALSIILRPVFKHLLDPLHF